MRKIAVFTIVLFLFPAYMIGQNNTVVLKSEAEKQMKNGRYGEAIDLLNRYISAKPQEAEGYNLRGLCFEKRGQYESAVYDFRSARKLEPNNKKITENLSRATESWYSLLYNKIAGHKREIAINPQKGINYVEIGHSYKNLGEWLKAEEWYDEYLKREEASPDEIIRYTEILAKNNHIGKGEPILKRYTEKYPDDHRLWSRYGYFALWLGKIKISIDAFEKALELRPFFKEAMDGLDQAKGKGYIYTVNDTSAIRGGSKKGGTKPAEYAIDNYYKVLKSFPEDTTTRYKLINELIKSSRIEEAHEQLDLLAFNTAPDDAHFNELRSYVDEVRDSIHSANLEIYSKKFEADPTDKESALKLAESYAFLYDFDGSIETLEKYLENPKGDALDVRFMLAKYASWSYQWNKASEQLKILLNKDPNNLEYQLLQGQLYAWNITEISDEEIETAKGYFNNVLNEDPENMQAILGLAYMYGGLRDYESSMSYINRAREVDPKSKQLEAVINFYNTKYAQEGEREILRMRGDVAKLLEYERYDEAALLYEEIIAKISEPDVNILTEYGYVNRLAKNYPKTIEIYDRLLQENYSYEIDLNRALAYVWSGDSLNAQRELQRLAAEHPEDFTPNFYLADNYERMRDSEKAVEILEGMLVKNEESEYLDSSQVNHINMRLSYLSAGGGDFGGGALLGYMAIAPISSYYADNQNLQFFSWGGRGELGLTSFLTAGVSLNRANLSNSAVSRNLSTFKGHLFLRFGNFSAGLGLGTTRTLNSEKTGAIDASLRYEIKDKLQITGLYEKNDARVLLFAPNLVNLSYKTDIFRILGNLNFSKFLISGYFSYLKISDRNEGNDFLLRLGKPVFSDLNLGYEFNYTNYALRSTIYYSPSNYESHSIWADWKAVSEPEAELKLGGRLGYMPSGDYILREVYAEAVYRPISPLTLSARVAGSSSYRFDSSYNSLSAYLTAYLSIY